MNKHGLTRENLVATLPPALQKDPSAVALAEAVADLLSQRPEEIKRLLLYPAIDKLDGPLLDILAHDFKVDWWDADYTLEEKRKTLKDSWRVHKLLGTKAAVVTAISAVYPHTTLEEWFEYGGDPFHFRLWINLTNDDVDSERMRRVLDRLNYYKSLRSHNDGIRYFTELDAMPQVKASVLYTGCFSKLDVRVPTEPKPIPAYQVQAVTGVAVKTMEAKIATVPVDMKKDAPTYRVQTGNCIGALGMAIEASAKQIEARQEIPVYHQRAAPGVAVSVIEAKLGTSEIHVNAEVPRYAVYAPLGVGVGAICMSIDTTIKEG
ncbi:phage tail protein I [uncultured Dysosmobacter sp.]|uniref:phage tail protein I n=1 Tax=uncultured Dysosmobacter sp. TaxID=2591384 RepID=UPI002609D98C|nr:phage tail protein I [uncultured Dysosmobacter sp.]